jgi:hypothetical protein
MHPDMYLYRCHVHEHILLHACTRICIYIDVTYTNTYFIHAYTQICIYIDITYTNTHFYMHAPRYMYLYRCHIHEHILLHAYTQIRCSYTTSSVDTLSIPLCICRSYVRTNTLTYTTQIRRLHTGSDGEHASYICMYIYIYIYIYI